MSVAKSRKIRRTSLRDLVYAITDFWWRLAISVAVFAFRPPAVNTDTRKDQVVDCIVMHTHRHRVSLCWTVTTQPIQCLLRVYHSPSVIAGVLRPKLPENPMSTITKALKKSRKRLPRFMITTNIGRCVLCCRCGRYGQHRRSMASSVLGYWHDHGANGSSLPTSLCLLPSPLFRG